MHSKGVQFLYKNLTTKNLHTLVVILNSIKIQVCYSKILHFKCASSKITSEMK